MEKNQRNGRQRGETLNLKRNTTRGEEEMKKGEKVETKCRRNERKTLRRRGWRRNRVRWGRMMRGGGRGG